MHKILLNSVLLSPIVSGSVRPKLSRQTPLGHNPLVCSRSWVGWGQEYGLVSVFNKNTRRVLSYDVLRQQKTGLWPRGLCPGGLTSVSRRVMSSPSQTLRRRLVRTTDDGRRRECSARRRPSRLYFSRLATRTVDNTVDLYAAKPDIRSESRFLPTPPAFDAPFRWGGGFPSEYRHPVWHRKTRMAWLPDGEKILKTSLFVLAQLTNVTDRQADTAWRQ